MYHWEGECIILYLKMYASERRGGVHMKVCLRQRRLRRSVHEITSAAEAAEGMLTATTECTHASMLAVVVAAAAGINRSECCSTSYFKFCS